MLKAVFFDAADTMIYLPRSVGDHYREVALTFGADVGAEAFNHAFKAAWASAPTRPSGQGAREDDDKGWWRELVSQVLKQVLSVEQASRFDQAAYFEAVYAHFAKAGVWQAFDDVQPTLEALHTRGLLLGVISNFDRRLHTILEGLGLSGYFDATIISSEVGADKPDPVIFQAALATLHVAPAEAMHVGDDPKKDWGADAIGLRVFRLERPERGLNVFLRELDELAAR